MNFSFQLLVKSAIGSAGAVAIATFVSLTSSANLVKAQNFDAVINGLFSPTQSERFFQEGRRSFESEVEILTNSEDHFKDDILQITPELLKPRQYPSYFRFKGENYFLSPDLFTEN